MKEKARAFTKFLAHCLCPTRCACCGKVIYYDQTICEACETEIEKLKNTLCDHCHEPLHRCTCPHNKATTIPCATPFPYTSVIQTGILAMKGSGSLHGVSFFAKAMAEEIRQTHSHSFDAIVYVPVTKAKKNLRGYNQCEVLAKALGKELNLPVLDRGLERLFDTVDLHKAGSINRKGCVFGVFEPNEALVADKTLLLIDDVITTGATMSECAKMLYLANAQEVYGAAIACTHLTFLGNQKNNKKCR